MSYIGSNVYDSALPTICPVGVDKYHSNHIIIIPWFEKLDMPFSQAETIKLPMGIDR